ncbi:MAG: DUF3857 domain-containing protein [Bacteroidota bacterium]
MKKIFLAGLALLLATCHISGQKAPVKFGKAVPEELTMSSCALDSSAPAVILFDIGNSEIKYETNIGWMYTYTRHTRIKIFKSSGYEWASFEIPLYHDASGEEKLLSVKGNTYNIVDGKVVTTKLDRAQVYREAVNKYWDNMKIEMPDVKEGSVVEITYYISSDFLFNLREWYFQTTIPTLLSEYHTRIPDYFKFHMFQKGYERFETTRESRSETVTQMSSERTGDRAVTTTYSTATANFTSNLVHMKAVNMPALKLEAYTLNDENYATSVEYELNYWRFDYGGAHERTTSWNRVNEILMEDFDFGGQIGKTGYAKDVIDRIAASTADPATRLVMAYDFVKKYIAWNKTNYYWVNTTLRDTYNRRSGSSAEINFILLNLLQELGIQCYPVVLSTRSNGIIPPTHPTLKKLNHMIVDAIIDGKEILLDASDPYFSPGILPEKCLNGQGVVIKPSGPTFVSMKPTVTSNYNSFYNLTLGTDGSLKGQLVYNHTGYYGIDERKEYDTYTEDAAYIKNLSDINKGMIIEDYKIGLDSARQDVFKLELSVDLSDMVGDMGDLVMIPVKLYDGLEDNPFKLEERVYPVNFAYPREVTNIITLKIPDGYTIDEVPEPKMISMPDNGGKFIFNISTMNNTIQLISKYTISKDEYLPSDYAILKEFFALIVDKHSQHIVLKKNL